MRMYELLSRSNTQSACVPQIPNLWAEENTERWGEQHGETEVEAWHTGTEVEMNRPIIQSSLPEFQMYTHLQKHHVEDKGAQRKGSCGKGYTGIHKPYEI